MGSVKYLVLSLVLHGIFLCVLLGVTDTSFVQIGITPIEVISSDGEDEARSSSQRRTVRIQKYDHSALADTLTRSVENGGSGNLGGNVTATSEDATLATDAIPRYPQRSRLLGEQGEVVLQIVIGQDGPIGIVQQVTLKKSSGYPRLDQSATDFLKDARFRLLAPLNGPLVKQMSILFRLND